MSDPFLTLNGDRANRARLRVPFTGRWWIDVTLTGPSIPSGAATVKIGALTLQGTILPAFSGVYVGQAFVRVVAGAGGWSKSVPARDYHNDAGVKRTDLIAAIAKDAGETMAPVVDATRLGSDYTRIDGPAWAALERVLKGTPWWVGYDGTTAYGQRSGTLGDVQLLSADPAAHTVVLSATDPSLVPIGSVLADARLDRPLTIRELEADVEAAKVRMTAWGTT